MAITIVKVSGDFIKPERPIRWEKRMKKTFKVAVVFAAVMMLASFSMAQDKALALLPGDVAIVGEIDFPTLTEFMNSNQAVKDQAKLPKFVMTLMGKANKAYFGMPAEAMMGAEPENFYAIVTGNLKTAELVAMAKEVAKTEGKELKFTNVTVAGLNAVKGGQVGEEEEDMLMADFPGGIVVGKEAGLTRFVAVRSGKEANVTSNAAMMNLGKSIPAGYGLKFYGIPGDMGGAKIDSIVFGMGLKQEIMSLLLNLRSTDPKALQQINQSIMMMKGMAGMMDETGKLAEVLENMKVNSKADGVDISLDVPLKVLEEISKSMAAAQAGEGM